MNRATTRIAKELKNLSGKEKPSFCEVSEKDSSDIRVWLVKMQAPKGSPFEGGVFRIEFDLKNDYPFKKPGE